MTPDRQFSEQRLADLYDLGNAGSEDRDFFLRLAGAPPQDILDLGCGTGLLALKYAENGHRVVGVDPADAMLKVARRARRADRVDWIESSAELFQTERRFDLITMTGHAFQVLLDDQQVDATLACMAQHLKLGGQAVFETRNPALDWDKIWAREYVMETPEGPVRASRRITDASRAPEYLSFAWDYQFEDGVVSSDSTLRFLSADKIVVAAEKAGLDLIAMCGDWDGARFDAESSREMIFKFRLDQAVQK
ncbi:MAG: class I SAM-dependent methyltransferase [Hyphomonadaceae bacterium]|nr:class I SAM-dependent methyltransferase [Hyphomonadaceae bacterium]